MMTKPKRETIRLAPHIATALRDSDEGDHNLSYLANRLLAVALDVPLPETHEEARRRGGQTGGRGRGREDNTTPTGE